MSLEIKLYNSKLEKEINRFLDGNDIAQIKFTETLEYLADGYGSEAPRTKPGEVSGLFKISIGSLRVHFMYHKDSIYLLYAFEKKSNKLQNTN